MNNAYNHGSQGDFFSRAISDEPTAIKASSAPEGTGAEIRLAARDGLESKLLLLLKKWKGDTVLSEPDDIGTTALHTAASHGNKKCVELLLEYGADKTRKNNVRTFFQCIH